MSDKKSEQKKRSSSAVWGQIGRQAKDSPAGQVSGLNRSIDSVEGLSGADATDLQQTYGNSFLQRVVQMGGGDMGEGGDSGQAKTEAGGVAENITPVSRDGATSLSGNGSEGESESESEIETRINRSRGQGQALPDGVRGQMEGKFGADFSGVTVHHDGEADQLNRELGAKAFTTGSDIYFQQGQYNPGSQSGQRLIAHELTHVVQQGGAAKSGVQPKLEVSEPDDKFEKEAEQVADSVMSSAVSPVGGEGQSESAAETADQTAAPESGMTSEAEEAADQAGVSTSEVDNLTQKANEKVAEGGDPKAVAKGAQKQITGNGGVGKPVGANGSMKDKAPKVLNGETKRAKENLDPNKIIEDKVAPGVKKPVSPEQGEADELKFDEAAIEEPAEAPLLPNWSELAYGTVQLFATDTASTEIDWRETQTEQSSMATASASTSADDGSAAASSESSSDSSSAAAEPEPLDRDELIKDALLGGAGEGVVMGATTWAADTLIEMATNSVPYADGWMNLGNIIMDPDGWAEGVKNTFSADNAEKTFGGWGDMSKETTTEGKVAFVLEKILGIIGWVEAINGFFQSMLQIGIAVLYLAWAIANSIPGGQGVAAAIMAVIKFLEWILKWLIFFGNLLLMLKPPLQFTAMGLRIADIKKAEADPQALLEKQAKLRGLTTEFTTGLTQRTLQSAAIKYRDVQAQNRKNEKRKQIEDLNPGEKHEGTGKSREQLEADFKDKYGEAHNAEAKPKKSMGRRIGSMAYGITFGVGGGAFSGIKNDWKGIKDAKKMRNNTAAVAWNYSRVKRSQEELTDGHTYQTKKNEVKDQKLAKEQANLDARVRVQELNDRNERLEGRITELERGKSDNRSALDETTAARDALKARKDAKVAEYDQADAAADQQRLEAENQFGLAENRRRESEEEVVVQRSKKQALERELVDLNRRLAEKQKTPTAESDGDGSQKKPKVDMAERQRKALEKKISQAETDLKRTAQAEQNAKAKMESAKEAKQMAQDAKQAAEAKKQEIAASRQSLEMLSQDIDAKTAEIGRLTEKQRQIEESIDKTEGDNEDVLIEMFHTNQQISREEQQIKGLERKIKDLDKDWKLKNLGDSYMPGTGRAGIADVFYGGDFHTGFKKFMPQSTKDWAATHRSRNLVEGFGAGGQRHGSGITGGLAGNFLADGVTFDWDWRGAMGVADWEVDTITDRVQIAVDLSGAPSGEALAPAAFFYLEPEETFGENSALGALETGDDFPDRLRIILPKSLFPNDNVSLRAKTVRVRNQDSSITTFTPTVSSVTVVESEGAVDEGTGEDRVVSGQKIKKYQFSVSYTKSEVTVQNKDDESADFAPNGLLLQRQAADGEEDAPDAVRYRKEKDILGKLPEPPSEAIYAVDASATAYNALTGEEYALQIQQQEMQQFMFENQAQQMEAEAGALGVETMQTGLDKHEQVTEQSQEAQKEMEAGAKQAEQPAQQGFDLSQEVGKLLQMLIQPLIKGLMTAGEESGSGNESGGAEEVANYGDMQGDAMDMATSATADSQAESRQWQAESAVLQKDIRTQKGVYKGLENQMDKQTADVEQSGDMILDAQSTTEEELDSVQDMMDDQMLEHEESISEVEDWADEHQEMRLSLYEQLESDLAVEDEPVPDAAAAAELEEMGLE